MSQNSTMELLQVGQPGPLRACCDFCKVSGPELPKCAGCQMVRFCSLYHQATGWANHNYVCKRIKAARTKLSQQDAVVQTSSSHLVVTAHGSQLGIGEVQILATTREFQQARLHLAEVVRKVGSLDGVRHALRHYLPMIREWPVEYSFVKGIVPMMMLQLDQDQNAYDLVKLWGRDDSADMSQPHLSVAGSNVYEDVAYLDKAHCDINLVCTALLLKTRLLMDMRNIRIVREIAPLEFSAEIVADIQLAVIRSSLSVQNLKLTGDDFQQREMMLNEHVLQLGQRIHNANGHFWKGVLDPQRYLANQPKVWTPGSPQEASFMVQYNYAAWYQSEGVIPTMKRALAMSKDKDDMCAMWSNFKAALDFPNTGA